MFNMCLKMPKRALGVLRNLQGHAIHHTRKTALQKMRRRQSIAIPIPQGKENLNKIKVRMCNGWFNGQSQNPYFEEGHPREGTFKGMARILEEQGYTDVVRLPAQCKNFKCPPDADWCCCRRLLHNQPDFVNVKSILQEHCERQGFLVQTLLKYHCELNPLEIMVWGRSKFHYRLNPPSNKESDLHQNIIKALEAVALTEMRRYVTSIKLYKILITYISQIFLQVCQIYGCIQAWTFIRKTQNYLIVLNRT